MTLFKLWLLWRAHDDRGVLTDHEEFDATNEQTAVMIATARADTLLSRFKGVVMLMDRAGNLIWSQRKGLPGPPNLSGF